MPDLLLVLVFWAQRTMAEKLTFHDELEVPHIILLAHHRLLCPSVLMFIG